MFHAVTPMVCSYTYYSFYFVEYCISLQVVQIFRIYIG